MFSRSSSAPLTAQQVSWSLTHRRLGRYFLGLDAAGNVIRFASFSTQQTKVVGYGGWNFATLAFGVKNEAEPSNSVFLESGHPMHYRASAKLEGLVRERRLAFERRVAQQQEQQQQKVGESQATASAEGPVFVEDETTFLNELAKELAQPSFAKRHLRVQSFLTRGLYHMLYASVWLAGCVVLLEVYALFKNWVDPLTRETLENIERKCLYYPKQVRWLLNEYLLKSSVWRDAQEGLRVGGEAAQSLIKEIPLLGDGARARQEEAEREEARRVQEALRKEEDRKQWWERTFASILMAILLLAFM